MAEPRDPKRVQKPLSPSMLSPTQASPKVWLKRALESTLPDRQCRLCCGWCRHSPLCPACLQALTDKQVRCLSCALPINHQTGDEPVLCGECVSHPPAFSQAVTAGHYQAPINHWLNNFKVRRDLRDGHLLLQLLIAQIRRHYTQQPLPQLLIPVPLHWSRLLSRGFNQSAWLAQQLHKTLGIDTQMALVRHSRRQAQKQLNRTQRQQNLNTAFRIKASLAQSLIGKHVALIDDVVTTSATVRAISQRLKHAGVAKVDIWSLARTDKTDFHH
ncbi:MAG: ComF family protein [Cellvibrionaceae bacterium]